MIRYGETDGDEGIGENEITEGGKHGRREKDGKKERNEGKRKISGRKKRKRNNLVKNT